MDLLIHECRDADVPMGAMQRYGCSYGCNTTIWMFLWMQCNDMDVQYNDMDVPVDAKQLYRCSYGCNARI